MVGSGWVSCIYPLSDDCGVLILFFFSSCYYDIIICACACVCVCDVLAKRFAERPRFFRCKQEEGGDLLRAVQSTFHNRESSYIEIE